MSKQERTEQETQLEQAEVMEALGGYEAYLQAPECTMSTDEEQES